MRYFKILLVLLMLVGVLLLIFSDRLLLIYMSVPFLNNIGQTKPTNKGETVKQYSGTVAAAYANGSEFFLKLKSWDMGTKEYVFKDFIANPTLNVIIKEASGSTSPASQSAEQKIVVTELKVNDEVALTYNETEKENRVSSITLTGVAQNSEGVIFGGVVGVQKDKLTVDSNKEMLNFGIDGSVSIGPKFKTEKVNGKTVTKPGATTVEKDFSKVEMLRQVEIIYTKGGGELLIAKTIYFLN